MAEPRSIDPGSLLPIDTPIDDRVAPVGTVAPIPAGFLARRTPTLGTMVFVVGLAGISGAAARDFTGFYAGVNGGFARSDAGETHSPRFGFGPSGADTPSGVQPGPSGAGMRPEDLPASMRAPLSAGQAH